MHIWLELASASRQLPQYHAKSYSGAPRPMKMGTIASPWRYDAAAGCALRPHNPGCPTIFRYALWMEVFPIRRLVRLPFDSGPVGQGRDRRDGPWPDIRTGCDRPLLAVTLNRPVALPMSVQVV